MQYDDTKNLKDQVNAFELMRQFNPEADDPKKPIHCIFHTESTPSMHYKADGGFWRCFGCGEHADIFRVVQHYQNCTFNDAKIWLQKYIGIMPNVTQTKTKPAKPTKPGKHDFSNKIPKTITLPDDALAYLTEKRGYTQETIEKFKIFWNKKEECLMIPAIYRDGSVPNVKRKWTNGDAKNVKGSVAALFNSAEIDNEGMLIICEGEPDCMLLDQYGYSAITNTAGASTFKKEWAKIIASKGRSVTLLYDNDEQGISGAERASKLLREHGVQVKNITLPKQIHDTTIKDVTDFFMAGGTKKELDALIQSAPVTDDTALHIAAYTTGDMYTMEIPEVEWWVDKIVPVGGISVISAEAGAYKTWVEYHMAECIVNGKYVFGKFKTYRRGKILICDMENYISIQFDRIQKLGLQSNDVLFIDQQSLAQDIMLQEEEHVKEFTTFMVKNEVKLVFLDTFTNFHGLDENKNSDMAKINKALKHIQRHGIDIVYLHHSRKPSKDDKGNKLHTMRGASALAGEVASSLVLSPDHTTDRVIVTHAKSRFAKEQDPFEIQLKEDPDSGLLTFNYFGSKPPGGQLKIGKVKEIILSWIDQCGEHGLPKQELLDRLEKDQVGKRTIERAVTELIDQGIIEPEHQGGVGNPVNYIRTADPVYPEPGQLPIVDDDDLDY